jgi:hypothetical protein
MLNSARHENTCENGCTVAGVSNLGTRWMVNDWLQAPNALNPRNTLDGAQSRSRLYSEERLASVVTESQFIGVRLVVLVTIMTAQISVLTY